MIKRIIKNNPAVYKMIMHTKNYTSMLESDESRVRKLYERSTGKKLNLENPESFNEKIQWLKLNWKKDILTTCADKFAVREYVANKIGDSVLNELYGVYLKPDDIDFEQLPSSFVLKVTHGSGLNILCRDKSKIDWVDTKKALTRFLVKNHYYSGREWAYKYIEPKIVCEKYLIENGKRPMEYKIFCFNGKPKLIEADIKTFTSHNRNMYDLDWNLMDFEYKYPRSEKEIQKPSRLNDMIEYAKILSEEFPFVRVDFYQVYDDIIFSEMTFYPINGRGVFKPDKYDYILGNWLELPEPIK